MACINSINTSFYYLNVAFNIRNDSMKGHFLLFHYGHSQWEQGLFEAKVRLFAYMASAGLSVLPRVAAVS